MGIQSAMYSGVSGLNANSQAMSVIGNNLANTNTLGFKSSRTVFSDLLSSNIAGSGGSSQVGRGVGLSSVDSIFSQGTFETTSSDTDVAIEGEGFFILKEPGNDTEYFSRAGGFRFNEDGYLVSPEGLRVQGKQFSLTNNDVLLDAISDIQVTTIGLSEANPTTELTFTTNLDANSTIIPTNFTDDSTTPPTVTDNPIDPANRSTYNYSASCPVFDSLGQSHLISVYWRLVDTSNTWQSAYTVDNDLTTLTLLPNDMVFDSKGQLPDAYTNQIEITWPNKDSGAVDVSTIDLSFDCTQYDSDSIVIGQKQNGYASGELTNVAITGGGIVVASYSNGRQINISQLILAKIQNPSGLQLAGANRYIASNETGEIRRGSPGPEMGKVFTNSLEQSNVDMGQEFVKMITTQRGFSANSKIITTVDEMLTELINLKR